MAHSEEGNTHSKDRMGRSINVCVQAEIIFLFFSAMKLQDASLSSSICHCLRAQRCEAPAFRFSSPIIIAHISCGSLLQIYLESPFHAIHRTGHSSSESDKTEKQDTAERRGTGNDSERLGQDDTKRAYDKEE